MTAAIGLIVAHDLARAIGVNGALPWHLPDDLKRFKALTLGHTILMGRKTYDSIGRALPGRRNLVLTRQLDWAAPGTERVATIAAALALTDGALLWVIGGGEVYAACASLAMRIELTLVHTCVTGATAWFPALAHGCFVEVARDEHAVDARHAHAFDFISMERSPP